MSREKKAPTPDGRYYTVQVRVDASTDEGDPEWLVARAARRAVQAPGTLFVVIDSAGEVFHREPVRTGPDRRGEAGALGRFVDVIA